MAFGGQWLSRDFQWDANPQEEINEIKASLKPSILNFYYFMKAKKKMEAEKLTYNH